MESIPLLLVLQFNHWTCVSVTKLLQQLFCSTLPWLISGPCRAVSQSAVCMWMISFGLD